MNKSKGFTIIELVVVIAIIAILATIVLIGISGYINKSRDASLKEDMHTTQIDVVSNATTGTGLAFSTATPCDSVDAWTTGVKKLQKGTMGQGSGTTNLAVCASNYAATGSANDKFCACVQELASTSTYICIDTTKLEETSTSCLTNCASGGNYTCP